MDFDEPVQGSKNRESIYLFIQSRYTKFLLIMKNCTILLLPLREEADRCVSFRMTFQNPEEAGKKPPKCRL